MGLIFGGRSVEHEVSVVSAEHVIAAADPDRFEVVPIGVTKAGVWLTPGETRAALARPAPPFKKTLGVIPSVSRSAPPSPRTPRPELAEGERGPGGEVGAAPEIHTNLGSAFNVLSRLDVVFPLVHGRHGEDGTLQGLLEIAGLPYVGCGVAASALGMDKVLMKALFRGEGLPVAEHIVFHAHEDETHMLAMAREVEERIGFPAFVKPANGGSSVGITKARSREELALGFVEAARCDRKIVVEKAVAGREVECAILGNEEPEASPVGEVRHRRDFYDFEAKYLDPGTEIIAPADLPPDVVERVRSMAVRAFRAIDGAGMSRVDFFLCPDGSLIIDEVNTIPGFTPASMFPRLWQSIGISYSALITRLVDLALARHKEMPIA